uniref:Insulin-like domain-containing protein n=1 Tax=Neogobius melanostomus TaxID=47308 RepID=A0A8C6UEC7_9GOBI
MTMAWRLTLVVAVVCVSSVCSSEQADLMSKLLMPHDYGIKLCGREFIRAVIYTCGGSRWRRSTDQEFETLQWTTQNDVSEEDNQHSSPDVSALIDTGASFQSPPSSSLADLLVIYGALGERRRQQQVLNKPNVSEKLSKISGDEFVSSLSDKWPMSIRKKRNFSRGVAGMCCSQGCTRNDIGRLC